MSGGGGGEAIALTKDALEELGRDVVAELAEAGKVTLAELAQRAPERGKKIAVAVADLGQLAARRVAGQNVDREIRMVEVELAQYEAIAAIVLARAAGSLLAKGIDIARRAAGEVLTDVAMDLVKGLAKDFVRDAADELFGKG